MRIGCSLNYKNNQIEEIEEKICRFLMLKNRSNYSINVCNDRNIFNKEIGRLTPEWMVAFTRDHNIYVLSPDAIDEESTHKKTEFHQILVHEITHIYSYSVNQSMIQWLDEGLALHFAGQKKNSCISHKNLDYFFSDNKLFKTTLLDDFADHQGYQLSHYLTERIFSSFDSLVINSLIRLECDRAKTRGEFNRLTARDFLKKIRLDLYQQADKNRAGGRAGL